MNKKNIYLQVNRKQKRMFLLKEDKPTNIKNLFTTLFLFIALSMNINAARVDNIAKVVFFKSNDLPFAAFQEILFHPTTQSYAKGNLVTSGYSESRISIYNLTNGKLIAQKNMGRIDSTEAFILLGYTPDNLWIYSLKYKSGLQSLDPITLERKISQATIYSKLTHTIGSFIMPQWHELKTSYGFSCIQQKLIVTNQQNEQFYIDAETFAPEKITELINKSRL